MRTNICVLGLLFCFILISYSLAQQKAYFEYYQDGMKAYSQKDYAKAVKLLTQGVELNPHHPTLLYQLARSHAQAGNSNESLHCLKRAVVLKGWATYDAENDAAFDSLKENNAFKSLFKKIEEIKKPECNSKVAFTIPEKDLLPEGVAYDQLEEKLYLGSIYKRKIIVVNKEGMIKDFAKEGQDDLLKVIGIEVAEQKRELWACSNFTEGPMHDVSGISDNRSAIFKYDLTTGKLIKKYPLDDETNRTHLLNDLTISSQGDVFITDTNTGEVYKISHAEDKLELFFNASTMWYLNGLALSPDEKLLFVAHGTGIYVIDVDTKEYSMLKHPEDVTLVSIDGLAFYENSLIAHQGMVINRIMRYYLNDTFDQVVRAETIEANNPYFDIPTTGEVAGDMYYYLANSQLRRVNEDGTLFPLDKLDEIVILKAKLK